MKMWSFVFNLPWTLFGFLLAVISIPIKFQLEESALTIKVRYLWWTEWFFWMKDKVRGITLGNTIILHHERGKFSLKHELIHVHQFGKWPFIFPLIYLKDFMRNGYWNNKFEKEAREE